MARFWRFFLAPGFLVVFSLSRYPFSSLSRDNILADCTLQMEMACEYILWFYILDVGFRMMGFMKCMVYGYGDIIFSNSPSMESIWPLTPDDASPKVGAGGPGAFFLPNTRFILSFAN